MSTPGPSLPAPPLAARAAASRPAGPWGVYRPAGPHPTGTFSPVAFGILRNGLRLLTLLPTKNTIYLLDVLAGKPKFCISRPAKILRPVNVPHELISPPHFCSESKPRLCSARRSARRRPCTPAPQTPLPPGLPDSPFCGGLLCPL